MANGMAYLGILLYGVHLIIYFFVRSWQRISWRISGVQKHLDAAAIGENYETSAQLVKVWLWPQAIRPVVTLHLHNFLTSHRRFVHPEYALQKHISLLSITKEHAIFSIPKHDVNVFDTKKSPFLYFSMVYTAEELLVMPIAAFNRLANSVPEPKAKVLWIYHTGRCGSTALGQIVNALPKGVTMSEPMSHVSLVHSFADSRGNPEVSSEYRQLFRNVVRMMLKPTVKDADLIAVKCAPFNALPDVDLLTEMFPKFKVIFIYRDVEAQVNSMYRAMYGIELATYITGFVSRNPVLSLLFPRVQSTDIQYNCCQSNAKHFEWTSKHDKQHPIHQFMAFVISYAEHCHHYRDLVLHRKAAIPAFKYEILMSDLKNQVSKLFDLLKMELTDEIWLVVEEALSADSQAQTIISKDNVSKKKIQITQAMIDEANVCLEYFNLPKWGESLSLPNTVFPVNVN